MKNDDIFETCMDELSDKIYVVVCITSWDSDGGVLDYKIISPRMNRNEAIKYIVDNDDIVKAINDQEADHTLGTTFYQIARYNTPSKMELGRTQAALLLRMVPEYITLTFEIDHATGKVTETFPRITQ